MKFQNLFDIAGTIMLMLGLSIFLWLVSGGHEPFTTRFIICLIVLFIGAIYFAKQGTP